MAVTPRPAAPGFVEVSLNDFLREPECVLHAIDNQPKRAGGSQKGVLVHAHRASTSTSAAGLFSSIFKRTGR